MALLTLPILVLSGHCMISQTAAFHAKKAPEASKTRHVKTSLASTLASTATAPLPKKAGAEARTAPSVVVTKFDSYAPTFESHLVDNLKYCTPRAVARAASERIASARGGEPYGSALDAGCGTGLAGPPLRPLVSGSLVGVDLSPKMAELAAELVLDDGPVPLVKDRLRRCSETARLALASESPRRLYDGVFTADLLRLSDAAFLDGFGHEVREMPPASFDLIVSADVLCYFGAMDEVLRAFSEKLAAGGDIIFTTETMNAGDYNWVETSSGRFAQDPAYVERVGSEAGLAKVSQEPFTPRMESGEKVLGTLHVFTKR